jgi:quercetin dioxygenase-like cupin family protein
VREARLAETGAGLVPASDGWFVVSVSDAAWRTNDTFGARCVFEADGRLAREHPQIEERPFPELGFRLTVIEPGAPSTLYHAESQQEDFLVLAGECLAIVEGEERLLRAWDFLHCPAGWDELPWA